MNKEPKKLTPAMEDYLEAIVELKREKDYIRVKDIASKLKVKMPTVTSMLKNLDKKGLVLYEKYEYVRLTDSGREVGEDISEKHNILTDFLVNILNISPDTADTEACSMEHVLSSSTFGRITAFMKFINVCPRAGQDWLNHFNDFLKSGCQIDECDDFVKKFKCNFIEKNSQ